MKPTDYDWTEGHQQYWEDQAEAKPDSMPLLPCPFCGPGNSQVECYQDDYGKWRVACGACGVHTGIRTDNDRRLVEKHWNTRAG